MIDLEMRKLLLHCEEEESDIFAYLFYLLLNKLLHKFLFLLQIEVILVD